ncbi:hypothetical protein Celaphus_00007294 [Cervus elaphus hippelaphus]|uniref:Cleavage and polyadenylation specificity factor subunit 4 n=1 Tax=Cervus elaphus hippelaphus TaxID=46360 RepID=A0A212CYY6_CEREH|nr:hypothetical protein Celaphus_00007294 [Cervus elaphus hippelaphus]
MPRTPPLGEGWSRELFDEFDEGSLGQDRAPEPPALPAVPRPWPLEDRGWVWVPRPEVDACLVPAGECSNKECPFLHIDPESKIKDCPWYDRGFCKHGSPRFELPMGTTEQPPLPQQTHPPTKRTPQVIGVMQSQNSSAGNRGPRPLEQVTCYKCGEKGHYANRCTKGHLAFLSGQ